jgi:hypothetical protein
MPRSRSFTSEFEEARRRAPKVGARAPLTLSGSDARWNDERPVVGPAVRTSRRRRRLPQRKRERTAVVGGIGPRRAGKYLTACARHGCLGGGCGND